MGKDQRLFYGTWAVAWALLAVCAGMALRSFTEAWFVTFPVAWTIALLVVSYKVPLRSIYQHRFTQRLLWAIVFGQMSWNGWERGIRRHDAIGKTAAVFIFLFVAALILSTVMEVFAARKGQRTSP